MAEPNAFVAFDVGSLPGLAGVIAEFIRASGAANTLLVAGALLGMSDRVGLASPVAVVEDEILVSRAGRDDVTTFAPTWDCGETPPDGSTCAGAAALAVASTLALRARGAGRATSSAAVATTAIAMKPRARALIFADAGFEAATD